MKYNYMVAQLQSFRFQIKYMVNRLQERNLLHLNKLHESNQAVPVSGISLSKVASQKIFVSAYLSPDLDPVHGIAWVFSKSSNLDPHTSCLRIQTRFVTPLSCDLEPEITKPTSRKIVVSADLAPDLDPVQGITRFFSEPSNIEPHTSRLLTQTRFVTPLSCDLEPDITKPTSRKIVVSSDLNPDLSASVDSGGVIDWVFHGIFLLNSSCHYFEKVDKGKKLSSLLWLRIAGYLNYILYRYGIPMNELWTVLFNCNFWHGKRVSKRLLVWKTSNILLQCKDLQKFLLSTPRIELWYSGSDFILRLPVLALMTTQQVRGYQTKGRLALFNNFPRNFVTRWRNSMRRQ